MLYSQKDKNLVQRSAKPKTEELNLIFQSILRSRLHLKGILSQARRAIRKKHRGQNSPIHFLASKIKMPRLRYLYGDANCLKFIL